MPDLNSASLNLIAEAGLDLAAARAVEFWRPFLNWEQLLAVDEIDDAALERLQQHGFNIHAPADAARAAPRPFELSRTP